jgi:predicted methyltransferase
VQRFLTSLALVLLAIAPAPGAPQAAQQVAADAERVIKALDLRPGGVVAEIGAGDGALTVLVAKAVGNGGRVFSTELSHDKVAAIRKRAETAGMDNVTAVVGRDDDTGLPDQCCDGIVMRDVYHHFAKPAAMNASILKALRPGGTLVILDFGPPPGSESADVTRRGEDGQHGITPATLQRELKDAGFEIVSTQDYGFRSSITIARRPAADPEV